MVASEWTKLHSLRSSRFSLLVAVGLVVSLGLLVPWLSVADWEPGTSTVGYNAVERSLGGIFLAQLAFGVLGVLVVSGEYASGMVRATFAAVPRRLPVLWAKLGVFVAVTLVLGTIACVLAFAGGQAIFATKHVDASLGDPNVLRAVLGAGLYLAAMGAFGLALGALLRNTAAGIATLTAMLFVVPTIVSVLPQAWARPDRSLPARQRRHGDHRRDTPTERPGAVDRVRGALRLGRRDVGAAAVMLVRRDV